MGAKTATIISPLTIQRPIIPIGFDLNDLHAKYARWHLAWAGDLGATANNQAFNPVASKGLLSRVTIVLLGLQFYKGGQIAYLCQQNICLLYTSDAADE